MRGALKVNFKIFNGNSLFIQHSHSSRSFQNITTKLLLVKYVLRDMN